MLDGAYFWAVEKRYFWREAVLGFLWMVCFWAFSGTLSKCSSKMLVIQTWLACCFLHVFTQNCLYQREGLSICLLRLLVLAPREGTEDVAYARVG
jgi:hypothetical protein